MASRLTVTDARKVVNAVVTTLQVAMDFKLYASN